MSEQQPTTDQRLAEAMASFGRDVAPPDDGWVDVVSGRVVAPAPPGRQRLVVALAAAVLVAVLVAAGAAIATRGEGEPARATIPPSEPVVPPSTETTTTEATTTTTSSVPPSSVPPSTEATTTSSVPTDRNEALRACLDARGVAYRNVQADGGYAISLPEPSTQAQRVAFNDGIDACSDLLWPRSDATPEERAEDRAYAEQYFADLVACLGEAGIAAEAVPSGSGAWEIETPGFDQASPAYRAVVEPCAVEAQANEATARAANGDS